MNLRSLISTKSAAQAAQAESLEALIARAESYGTVSIYGVKADGDRPAGYLVLIAFHTIKDVKLEANSEYRVPLADGLRQAIDKAEQIRGQFR